MLNDLARFLEALLPSFIGAVGSLFWIKEGSLKRKIFLFILSFYVGYKSGSYLNELTHIPSELASLTMGLYAVSLISKAFEAIEKANLLDFIPGLKNKFGDKE